MELRNFRMIETFHYFDKVLSPLDNIGNARTELPDLTLIKMGFLRVVYFGGGQFDSTPPFNANITLYNC